MERSHNLILDDKWLRAAVLGSLWASFEIIVGSLLHNLRIPFAGTFLTLFSVILLVAFSRIWPQRGVLLRAGVICAMMKSISPSAVILGPMIGILTEAFILEITFFTFGRNLFTASLGGAIAVLSALMHKIINLMILYGFNLIEIYTNMINYAANQLHALHFSPEGLFYALILLYLLTGAAGGVFGFYLGSGAANKVIPTGTFKLVVKPENKADITRRFSLFFLALHVFLLIAFLFYFEQSENILYKTGIFFIYLTFSFLYYKTIAGRLMKPVFWIQLFMILLLAGLFLETSDPEKFSIRNAITAGWSMFLRAILVITAFSAISAELANPKIREFLMAKGFKKMYMALQLSFSALPAMLENNSNLKTFFRNPVRSFILLIADAENWFESFKNQHQT